MSKAPVLIYTAMIVGYLFGIMLGVLTAAYAAGAL